MTYKQVLTGLVMRKFNLNFLLLSSLLIVFYFFSNSSVNASTILFNDDFEEGGLFRWQVVHGTWNVVSDQEDNHWLSNITANSDSELQAGDFSWTNYKFSVDINPQLGLDANLFFRVNNQRSPGLIFAHHDLPVSYGIHISGSLVELQKWTLSGGNYAPPLVSNSIVGGVRNISIIADGSNIKIFVNNSISPLINYTDNDSPLLSGRIALAVIPGSPSQVWYDNVVVTDLGQELPSLNVPNIKQYTLPWGNEVYDTATAWSYNPTISHWGCALTSVDMILNYYGFGVDPGALNNWLISQSDGYIRNGLLNWLAISRYSKRNKTTNQPSLEFTWKANPSQQDLIDKLNSGIPVILEEPGHYIVAKSQTLDSFGINDPAFNYQTLASYQNNFQTMRYYIPSNTNLSYFMLTIDPQFDIKVFDSNGKNIGDTVIQTPLTDDQNGDKSGNPIKILTYSMPTEGEYQVFISGNGSYELDSYIYNVDGEVNFIVNNGIVGSNHEDEYKINIGQTNSIRTTLTETSIIDDWMSLNLPNQNVVNLIKNSRKLLNRGNKIAAKSNLNSVISYLNENTPELINFSVSQILQSEIQKFIALI